MAQLCTVCKHPNKRDIERDILSGRPITAISREYDLHEMSLHNHKHNHLSARMVKVYQTKEALADFNMMQEFNDLIDRIKKQIARLEKKESEGLTIAATGQLIKLYGVMAQFASVYYQANPVDRQNIIEEQAQQEEEELQNRLSILTFEELKLFQALVNKIETQDEGIDVISNINNESAAVMYELLDVVPNIVPEAKIQTKPRLKRTILPNNELADLRVREI